MGRALGSVRMHPDVGGVWLTHHSVLCVGHAWLMPDVVNQLLATEVALDKLGARGISGPEAEQAIWNRHVVIRNRRGQAERRQREVRRLLIGRSDAAAS